MSDSGYLKCSCSYCQGHIEFPAHAAGITVTCPHCGVETTLVAADGPAAPASPPSPPPPTPGIVLEAPAPAATEITPVSAPAGGSKLKRILNVVWSVLVGIVVVALIGLKVWSKYRKVEHAVETVKGEPKPEPPKPASGSPKPAPMPPPVAVPTSVVVAKGAPPERKPGEDLQILSFEVQKAKDGSLQYVIGVVTNHSAKQYFNVKLEFELTRKDGKTGEIATDSIRNLAGNAGMPFKASIIGTAPVAGAKVAKLEGEKE